MTDTLRDEFEAWARKRVSQELIDRTRTARGYTNELLYDAYEAYLAGRAAADEDRKLLDSGCIMTHERDEFGMEYMCERRGLNLRAAIRAAIQQEPTNV